VEVRRIAEAVYGVYGGGSGLWWWGVFGEGRVINKKVWVLGEY
jgi:hypothetical protein